MSCAVLSIGFQRVSHGQERRLAVADRAAEARYQKLIAEEPTTAKEWYMVGDWCFMVAGDLSPRSRDVFHERGRESMQRGKRIVLRKLEEIFTAARSAIEAAETYEEALAARGRAREAAEECVREITPIVKEHESQLSVLASRDRGLAELDGALLPIANAATRERITRGLVPVHGEWVPMDEERSDYAGTVPLRDVVSDPESWVGKIVCADLDSSLQLFYLLGGALLDGYDDDGRYLVPNFMEDRLVIAVPEETEKVLLGSRVIEQKGDVATADLPGFRVRLVMEIQRRQEQFTSFFAGEVSHLAVFDDGGELVDFVHVRERL